MWQQYKVQWHLIASSILFGCVPSLEKQQRSDAQLSRENDVSRHHGPPIQETPYVTALSHWVALISFPIIPREAASRAVNVYFSKMWWDFSWECASRHNGAQLKAPIITFQYDRVIWCTKGFRTALNWAPMIFLEALIFSRLFSIRYFDNIE